MKHPNRVWVEPSYQDESLEGLRETYRMHLEGGSTPASPGTVDKYNTVLISFTRSLQSYGEPLTLASLTPSNVNRWVSDQRKSGKSEDGISSRLAALKAFSHKYVFMTLDLTTEDLLSRVRRITPPAKPFPKLTQAEQDSLFDAYPSDKYQDVRDRALIATYLSTGRRFVEVIQLELSDVNIISGETRVRSKGGDQQPAYLSTRALKALKAYLRIRSKRPEVDRLWLTDEGTPLTYWGAQSIFRRLKVKSGIKRLHSHLFRHTFAQTALEKGAERGVVQDMLGHKTPEMTRRYAGAVRQSTAARQMPKYAPY